MKKILSVIFLILLFIGLIVSVFLVREQTQLSGKAISSGVLSLENSYLFASPLVAKIGGEEKITISVFVLSDQGLGIPGQIVSLYSAPPLQAKAIQETTDPRGLAVFEISSTSAGRFNIWATVPTGMINQTVSVTFTQ